ncbi:slc25a42, partial [Symbiodinium pilosum]
SGSLPAGPICYGGTLLTETFSIHVISHDGEVGVVDMKAVGPMAGECDGANFQNNDNVITVDNDHGCGLASYEYTDHVIVNLVKPYAVSMVLESQACPAAGEV